MTHLKKLSPPQKVILVTGPGGSGKKKMCRMLAQKSGWVHISEDHVWNEVKPDPNPMRTEEEKAIVQPRAIEYMIESLNAGSSIAFDFIVYDNPPQPLQYYFEKLTALGIPTVVRVLMPTVDEIIALQRQQRGEAFEAEMSEDDRRRNASHQIACLSHESVKPEWVIDSNGRSFDAIFETHFEPLV